MNHDRILGLGSEASLDPVCGMMVSGSTDGRAF